MSISDEINDLERAMRVFARDSLSTEWEQEDGFAHKPNMHCHGFEWLKTLEYEARLCVAQSLWQARCRVATLADGTKSDKLLRSAVEYGVDFWFRCAHPADAKAGGDIAGGCGDCDIDPIGGAEVVAWADVRNLALQACERLHDDLCRLRTVREVAAQLLFTNPAAMTPTGPSEAFVVGPATAISV